MPARKDISSILLIGAGPIVIGQACEFDYSGTQAVRALKEEGYRVILANSNPATIMTDPELADATYIEPLTWRRLAEIIEREKPDALLPTMGGQTALNLTLELEAHGVLAMHGVELIGASARAIRTAEDRELFRDAMDRIGLASPVSRMARTMAEAESARQHFGLPCVIRPSFTLGGSGGGIARSPEEFREICARGLQASPTSELLIEESLLGWKEFELEVVRDRADNAIIVCAIENLDPMGVHTGDSITVAPPMTLTDREYQGLRDASIAVLREIGVDTGGSNVQFAVNPRDGRAVVIEMNPRVSRSSALASKATGFPIARVAAKLAIGYTLDELKNELTGGRTPASFEPSLDYVVVKAPRFAFEKFPAARASLGTQMSSVGEAMALGGSFAEALQKALRSLESGLEGLDERPCPTPDSAGHWPRPLLESCITVVGPERLLFVAQALREGWSAMELHALCAIDPWFLRELEALVTHETELLAFPRETRLKELEARLPLLKRLGFSDARLARLCECAEQDVRALRHAAGLHPVYKRVDSCAAEFEADTAYLYSTWGEECEARPDSRPRMMILGSGPNRIGQGIEFDYCCVHAALALREAGFQTIMVNCNPETVSTDTDTSDRLYFEPLCLEEVLEIVRVERPSGVVIQYGGQTPLKLARALEEAGVPILGTPPAVIDLCEDRQRFHELVTRLGILQPAGDTARNAEQALALGEQLGYPLMVRPSYVLGGRSMEVVHDPDELGRWLKRVKIESGQGPVLLDRYLENSIELDVDLVCDGQRVLVAGIMQHIEEAGIHSGDSACSFPPHSLESSRLREVSQLVTRLALELGVVGLMNAQLALHPEGLFLLEVNPRASRTVPFIAKARGFALAKVGALVMSGMSLSDAAPDGLKDPGFVSVKQPVFPFGRFPGSDPLLGPEMKSTGEVMGMGRSFPEAFAFSQLAAGTRFPMEGRVFISVRDEDKPRAARLGARLHALGLDLLATGGTAAALHAGGIPCLRVPKVNEARLEGAAHIVDHIAGGGVDFLINTTGSGAAIADSFVIREAALRAQLGYTTTLAAAEAFASALENRQRPAPLSLQELLAHGYA
ncbi:MAG: carbamoyl-phosphate synthase large subunit [Candidatus Cloacimonetes bacterium]|nr:carbamoyl-phosphate synthase large subunit [Candidatus Cloacimonadota bacterium]